MVNLLLRWAVTARRERWKGAYIAPFYRQAKMIAWDYLKHYGERIPGIHFDNAELTCITPNGSKIHLLGADNEQSLRGPYWDSVIFDEYAQIRPNAWPEIIRPALVDRKGWAIFIGTPKGKNHFWDLWNAVKEKDLKDWSRVMFKASETDILDKEELENARKIMAPEEYEQEFECSWEAALVGSYYGPLILDLVVNERGIGDVPHDPNYPVHTAWDLGVDDETVIWFFQLTPGGEIRIIDYEHGSNASLEIWISVIKNKKYIYGSHLGPHDINVRDYSTGKERINFARAMGIQFNMVPRHNVADGIQAVRSILPMCRFDQMKCHHGIEALKSYRKEYSQRLSVYRDRPYHDWASNPADAFRTLAMGLEIIHSSFKPLKMRLPNFQEMYGDAGWML